MNSTYFIIFFALIIVIIVQAERRKSIMMNMVTRKFMKKGAAEMLELAKRFIGKDCIVYTLNSQVNGTIKEVSDNAVVIVGEYSDEIVNADYIIRIREYPKNKKGKKKSFVCN